MQNSTLQKQLFTELLRPARSLIFDPDVDPGILPRANLFTFIFIRHPFERLVSAYLDKFIVQRNSAFVKAMINYEMENGLVNHKMNFEHFINFVIDEISTDSMSEGSLHWWPYSSLCKMCEIDYSYIGYLDVGSYCD